MSNRPRALLRIALASAFVVGCTDPPAVTLREQHEAAGDDFAHPILDALLRTHVQADGFVDYAGLGRDAARLDQYIATLAEAPFTTLSRNAKLAFLINAYNACTLRLILDHPTLESIKDIPAAERWEARRWRVAGETVSLNDLEHRRIRPEFAEPRIHFALVCAAVGCPPLRAEAYAGGRLEDQLQAQAQRVHGSERWLRYQADDSQIHLTPLYRWYANDFRQAAGSTLQFARRYVPQLGPVLDAGTLPTVHWLPYDWRLNDIRNNR